MNLILKKVHNSDLAEISAINSEVQAFPWSRLALAQEVANADAAGFLAWDEKSQAIAGYIFLRLQGDEGEIMTLGVRSAYQRRGVATFLIQKALSSLPQVKIVFLEVSQLNEAAQSLYLKLGFAVSHTRKAYYPDGSDAICMRLAKTQQF